MNPRLRRWLQPRVYGFERARRQIAEIRTGDPLAKMFAEFGRGTRIEAPQLGIVNPGSIALGNDVHIFSHVWIEALAPPGNIVLRMHDRSGIGHFGRVVALNGIEIGEGASVGHYASVSDTVHTYRDPAADEKGWHSPLRLGRSLVLEPGATIGNNCVVTGGITIGANAIIAPNSVISRDVPPDTIVGGNPARILRRKRPDDEWEWMIDPATLDLQTRAASEPAADREG